MEKLDAIISKKSYLRFSSSNLLAPAEDKYTKIQSIQDLLFVSFFILTIRARAYVELRDLTGSNNATIIGEPAEKFLQCTADKLMQEDANPDILQVVRTITGEDYILYVKALNNDPSVGQIKYEVVFILHPVSIQEMSTNTEMNSLENLLTTSKQIPNEENSKSVTIPVRRALILPQIN
ncbi:Nucleic acid-binding [Forsythia ovata]|uniref:Nucleic acid-binding n=1 Tax=Forsythia ovata TaxID=205694 RepID=A0ABD1SLT2_9LAMI